MPDAVAKTFFGCTESPLKLTSADITAVRTSYSCESNACKLRLTSKIAGMGAISTSAMGITFDSPQTFLEYNGVRYTCYTARITVPAMHAIPDPSGAEISAELQLFFRGEGTQNIGSYLCLVSPITTGDTGDGVDFFRSLGALQRNRPPMGTLFQTETPMLLWRGISIEHRKKNDTACSDSALDQMTYVYVLRRLTMRQAELARFKKMLDQNTDYKTGGGPRIGTTSIAVTDTTRSLITYIPSFASIATTTATATASGYVPKAQVKCRPLDVSRDIKGDTVYVGGPGGRSLDEELNDASNLANTMQDLGEGSSVRTVEQVAGIILGVAIGILIVGSIAYWFLQKHPNFIPWAKKVLRLKSAGAGAAAAAAATATAMTSVVP